MKETTLKQRIRAGKLTRADVAKRLAELAYGEANDCTVLVLDPEADLRKLDLRLRSEVKRSEKGAVEVKLLDRLKALEMLTALTEEDGDGMAEFLRALNREEG